MSNQMFNAAFDAVTESHPLKEIKDLFLAGPKTVEDALKINKAFQDHFYHEVDYRCLFSLISTRDFEAISNAKGALHALLTHLQECRKEYLAEKTHADSFWNTFIKKELPQPVLDRLFFIACEVNERVDREYTRSFADFVLYTIYSISTEQNIIGVSEYIDWWCFDDFLGMHMCRNWYSVLGFDIKRNDKRETYIDYFINVVNDSECEAGLDPDKLHAISMDESELHMKIAEIFIFLVLTDNNQVINKWYLTNNPCQWLMDNIDGRSLFFSVDFFYKLKHHSNFNSFVLDKCLTAFFRKKYDEDDELENEFY